MSSVKILMFAADPHSAAPRRQPRLLLDEEVRQIDAKMRAAKHRKLLSFRVCWATRTDDLLQALNETPPHVVHFSGHGGSGGLVLVSADGKEPHSVDAAALTRLFEVFRGDIRVVLLNACFSLPQAHAIAEVVGCAIGTRQEIGDDAAITFASSFYRAIAFGHSVKAAFDQASAALALEHVEDSECPVLLARADVDPARLFLVSSTVAQGDAVPSEAPNASPSTPRRGWTTARRWVAAAAAAVTMASGAVIASRDDTPRNSMDPLISSVPKAGAPSAGASATVDFETAKAWFKAGRYTDAFRAIEREATAGNPEAMGLLGIMYLKGLGVSRLPTAGASWLKEAADKDDPRGMNARGEAFEAGEGLRQSYRWARFWYERAAREKAYVPAMVNLADTYRDGLGTEVDYDSAMAWYTKASEAGSADAMAALGVMYQNGWGVRQSRTAAIRWFRRAAERGSAAAQANLDALRGN